MFYLFCDQQKQDTFKVYCLWSVFVFSGLSLRRTSERLAYFIRRNHVSIWNWIQKYHPRKIISQKRRMSEFIVDETLLQVGSEYVWFWIVIESENREILALF